MGHTTTYVYDYELNEGSSRCCRIIYPAVETEVGQVVTPTVNYTYNSWGLLESVTDAGDDNSVCLYSRHGR